MFILTTPNRIYRLKPGQKPWNRFHIREYYPHDIENILKIKFGDVKILGIRGNEEVQRIEIERVKPALKSLDIGLIIKLLDPLKIRKLMPSPLKSWIINTLKRKLISKNQKNESDMDFIGRYNLKVYYIIENNVEGSLDILGVCKK